MSGSSITRSHSISLRDPYYTCRRGWRGLLGRESECAGGGSRGGEIGGGRGVTGGRQKDS